MIAAKLSDMIAEHASADLPAQLLPLRTNLSDMSARSGRGDLDPVVVPIVEEFDVSMDDWLASLRGAAPIELATPTAELLAAARAETA